MSASRSTSGSSAAAGREDVADTGSAPKQSPVGGLLDLEPDVSLGVALVGTRVHDELGGGAGLDGGGGAGWNHQHQAAFLDLGCCYRSARWACAGPFHGPWARAIRAIHKCMLTLRFEWDPAKSDPNLRRRGFDFQFASSVFDGPTVEAEDRRRDYGERRVIVPRVADSAHLTPDLLTFPPRITEKSPCWGTRCGHKPVRFLMNAPMTSDPAALCSLTWFGDSPRCRCRIQRLFRGQ